MSGVVRGAVEWKWGQGAEQATHMGLGIVGAGRMLQSQERFALGRKSLHLVLAILNLNL